MADPRENVPLSAQRFGQQVPAVEVDHSLAFLAMASQFSSMLLFDASFRAPAAERDFHRMCRQAADKFLWQAYVPKNGSSQNLRENL